MKNVSKCKNINIKKNIQTQTNVVWVELQRVLCAFVSVECVCVCKFMCKNKEKKKT